MWKRLYQRLVTDQRYELIRPPAEEIDAGLKRVEDELGVPPPASYTAFIHQFGPSEIGGYFRIYGPPIPGFADYGNDVLEEIRQWRKPGWPWEDADDPTMAARLACFSTTIGGDALFWDLKDVRNDHTHEYGIYVLTRESMDHTLLEVAPSFQEFVERHCLGNDFCKIIGSKGWEDEEGGLPPQNFRPAWEIKWAANRWDP